MSLILSGDWYDSLVEDCKAIYVERVYRARQELIEMYHQIGERIATDENWQKHARGNGETLNDLSKSTEINRRHLYNAITFYEKYPDEEDWKALPEGKNISWNKIVTNYLPKKADEQPDPLPRLIRELVGLAEELTQKHKDTLNERQFDLMCEVIKEFPE